LLISLALIYLWQNVKKKAYGSTEALVADVKWIVHNCIIYNGSTLILIVCPAYHSSHKPLWNKFRFLNIYQGFSVKFCNLTPNCLSHLLPAHRSKEEVYVLLVYTFWKVFQFNISSCKNYCTLIEWLCCGIYVYLLLYLETWTQSVMGIVISRMLSAAKWLKQSNVHSNYWEWFEGTC